jgi:hypothetical protein
MGENCCLYLQLNCRKSQCVLPKLCEILIEAHFLEKTVGNLHKGNLGHSRNFDCSENHTFLENQDNLELPNVSVRPVTN